MIVEQIESNYIYIFKNFMIFLIVHLIENESVIITHYVIFLSNKNLTQGTFKRL